MGINKMFEHISQKDWQNALRNTIIIVPESNNALYERAVRLFSAPGSVAEECMKNGVLPPKIHIYAGDELPEGVKPQADDGKTLNVAMGNDADAMIIRRMMSTYEYSSHYLQDARATDSLGRTIKVSVLERMEDGRGGKDKEHPRSPIYRGVTRSRGDYNPIAYVNRSRWQKINTWGQLRDWQAAYQEHLQLKKDAPDQPTLWEFYQRQMFSDEVMQKFSGQANIVKHDSTKLTHFPLWKDWLRGLRVMNGIGTKRMSEIFFNTDGTNSGWNAIENKGLRELDTDKVRKALEMYIFRLPEIEHDGCICVDPAYAAKFCRMIGNGETVYAQPIRKHFLARVKAAAEDYCAGKITIDDMPTINDLLRTIGAKHAEAMSPSSIWHDKFQEILTMDGENYAKYFAAMPKFDYAGKKIPHFASFTES